jgi:hypothetical protein
MTPNSPHGRIDIFAFVDALGWEVLRGRKFLDEELPHRRPVRSVMGYSSACVPSILTGKQPRDHGQWSFFYCSPATSPFKALRPLALLPSAITGRARVRNLISKLVAKARGFTGYFQLYQLPFKHAHEFDYCEKRDLFEPGGLATTDTIFDVLRASGIPFHKSNWRASEDENLRSLQERLPKGDLRFAFLYLADLDGLLHQVGKHHPSVTARIASYEARLRALLADAREHYSDVRFTVISDHGMATVDRCIDVQASLAPLGLRFGRDYVAAYDSTMARFWFRTDAARRRLPEALAALDGGHVLSEAETIALGVDFEGHKYGELIFLTDPGCIIVPSHMGLKPITGMHGYHPDHPDSDAILLSTHAPAVPVETICDFNRLMQQAIAA